MNRERQEILYFKVTDIWQRFCELHSQLYEVTCDEYSFLLASDIEEVERKTQKKNEVITQISQMEKERENLIQYLNKEKSIEKEITSVSSLLDFFASLEIEKEKKHLFRFNALLVDMIEKIQEQNKRNQLFLNKAINSLRSIREEAMGQKSYSTYNNNGKATSKSI